MEPYYNLYVLCAESMMGDVIGDLNSKRGRILGMQSVEEGISRVEAQVPYAEIMEYAVDLRALTQGMGTFEMKFDHYEDQDGGKDHRREKERSGISAEDCNP